MALINTTGGEDRDMDELIGLSETLRDKAQNALDTIVRLDGIIEEKNDKIKALEDEVDALKERVAELEEEEV